MDLVNFFEVCHAPILQSLPWFQLGTGFTLHTFPVCLKLILVIELHLEIHLYKIYIKTNLIFPLLLSLSPSLFLSSLSLPSAM